ncbi:hypothetical protein ABIE89_005721 [Bradyrhizobium niftali]|uniref:TniQ family protein n=1 Tax=Bradyrhizobium niftali TaxID=2560055 RepID=UPI003837769E
MQKLALTIAAGTSETPTSYASRLAARNFVSARNLLRDFGLSFQKVSDGDEHTIRQLARLGGAAFETLISNAIRKVGSIFSLRGEQVSNSMIRRARVHICPSCIKDDMNASPLFPELAAYGRPEWAIPFFRTCAKHSMALVQVGSSNNHHEFHDFTRNIASALPDIDRLIGEAGLRTASNLEVYLLDRLQGRRNNPWLDSLPFFAAATTTELVGAVIAFGKSVNLDALNENDRYRAGAEGFDILKAGADGIKQFMTELKSGHRPRKAGSADGLRATYGRFYTCLGYGLRDPAYDPVRAVMTDHILAHFPLGPGDELFGKPVEERRFHSIRTASKAYGLHPARLRKLVKAEGIMADPSVKDRDVLFDAEIADRLFKREDDSLSMTQVTKYINATRSVAANLLQAGLIKPHNVGIRGTYEVFFRSELDELLTNLYRDAELVVEPTPEICDLMFARRSAYASTSEMLRLILDKRLWAGRKPDSRGVFGLLVKIDEVRALATQTEIVGILPSYVGQELKIHSKALTRLLKLGVLKPVVQRHPVNGRPMTLIPYEEIERFNAEYISLFMLARSQRKSMPDLLRQLNALGVRPAFEGLGASIFRRSDLPT